MKTITDCQTIGESTMITSDCIAIAFKRPTGSNPVNVIGYPLAEGETLTISQNVGDFDKTQYSVLIHGVYRSSDRLLVKRKKWKMSSRSMH